MPHVRHRPRQLAVAFLAYVIGKVKTIDVFSNVL